MLKKKWREHVDNCFASKALVIYALTRGTGKIHSANSFKETHDHTGCEIQQCVGK